LPLRDVTEENINTKDITDALEQLQWCLQEKKLRPHGLLALASHPFLRPCDACGIEYASPTVKDKKEIHDRGEEEERYCVSCQLKRARDRDVKIFLDNRKDVIHEYMWHRIISLLLEMHYEIPELTNRPLDFDAFRNFKGAKDYFALVYADGNNMGRAVRECKKLPEYNARMRQKIFAFCLMPFVAKMGPVWGARSCTRYVKQYSR
jgi:CRISPR/Cas system-associated protein Cas10 (large subunit of type III CRISPR-Cas system)